MVITADKHQVNIMHEVDSFRKYLEQKAVQQKISHSTIDVYVDAVARWLYSLDGDEPTVENAQKYINLLALSPSTVNLRAHAIIKYFDSRGEKVSLECPSIRYPAPKYKSMWELKKVLRRCNNLLEETLITVLFDTAVRISELLNLCMDDINWEMGLITVTRKGGRKEDVNISPKAMEVLKRWVDSRDIKSKKVFGNLAYIDAWHIIRKAGKRAGVNLSPHMLRHSRAIQMLMHGAPMHIVQQHLGHVNIATTMNIYGRFRAVDLKKEVPEW